MSCPSCGYIPHAPGCPIGEREAQNRNLRAKGSPNTLGGCGCVLLVVAAVGAAIIFGFNFVAAQIMPDRGLSAETAAAIAKVTGKWEGTYLCDGKRRAMRLTVTRGLTKGTDLRARYAFWDGRTIKGEPTGETRLSGHHNGKMMVLTADSWVKRAPGFVKLDVQAPTPSGEPLRMSGTLRVSGTNRSGACKTFSVTKR